MYPVNGSALVFDAFAGVGVVLHDFTGADLALCVYLPKDDGAEFCGSEEVVLGGLLDLVGGEVGGEDGGEEMVEMAVRGKGFFDI